MSDALFRGIVTGSLVYQSIQATRMAAGIQGINLQLSGMARQVDGIAAELAQARKDQQLLNFWKDKIFLIRKSMEAAKEELPSEVRQAYFLSTSVLRYLQVHNISSSSYSEIADKEYWHQTLRLVHEVKTTSTALLPQEEPKQLDYLSFAIDVRDALKQLIGWIEAKSVLIPFIEKRGQSERLTDLLRKPLGCLGMLAVLPAIIGCGWLLIVIAILTYGVFTEGLNSMLKSAPKDASFYFNLNSPIPYAITGLICGSLVWIFRKIHDKRYLFGPKFPTRASAILQPLGWNLGYEISPQEIDSYINRYHQMLHQRGLAISAPYQLAGLKAKAAELDSYIDAWRRKVILDLT